MSRWVLSREAGLSLAEIEDYTAQRWGDAQAEKYIRDLFAAFDLLADTPTIGRSRPDIPPPYLGYGVGSHLIIYRTNEARGSTDILNILHPAMNIEKRLTAALRRPAGT